MKREREGRRTGGRASAPSFPPEDEMRSPSPSHADSSHIARRRLPSAPAHEVDLDEVELFDDSALPALAVTQPSVGAARPGIRALTVPAQSSRVPARSSPPAPRPSPLPPLPPPSPAPARARSSRPPFQVPLSVAPPRRHSSLSTILWLALALLAAAVGAAVAFTQHSRDLRRGATSPLPLPAPSLSLRTESQAAPDVPVVDLTKGAPPAPGDLLPAGDVQTSSASSALDAPPSAPKEVPVVDVTNLPHPADGLVTGSPGHRLWVDGTLAPSWKVSVPCGSHVVQVGSAGVPRTVVVPCGSTIFVSP